MWLGIRAYHIENWFHSLNHEISVSHSISNTNITKKLNSTVFDFDVVIIIGVTRNTGISYLKHISFTQSWDINISFTFKHENHANTHCPATSKRFDQTEISSPSTHSISTNTHNRRNHTPSPQSHTPTSIKHRGEYHAPPKEPDITPF